MAAGKEKIDYNYREMIELAAELNDIAGELANIKGSFDAMLSELGAGWKGKAAKDYQSQGNGVSGLMRENMNDLNSVSSGIKRTAAAYREAEYEKLEQTKGE